MKGETTVHHHCSPHAHMCCYSAFTPCKEVVQHSIWSIGNLQHLRRVAKEPLWGYTCPPWSPAETESHWYKGEEIHQKGAKKPPGSSEKKNPNGRKLAHHVGTSKDGDSPATFALPQTTRQEVVVRKKRVHQMDRLVLQLKKCCVGRPCGALETGEHLVSWLYSSPHWEFCSHFDLHPPPPRLIEAKVRG